jgi:hypothetical protein
VTVNWGKVTVDRPEYTQALEVFVGQGQIGVSLGAGSVPAYLVMG